MKKYLKNGQQVTVVKEIEGGFLYKLDYTQYSEEDDFYYENEDEIYIDETIYFSEVLYDNPPVEKYHKSIIELKKEIESIECQILEINKLKKEEESLLTSIKKRDFVQGLVDYLNGDFKYVLYLKDMEIKDKNNCYISEFVKITNTKGSGYSLYKLRSEEYESYDDTPIMVFKSFDEAQLFAKNKLIERLVVNTEKSNYKWGSRGIEDWYKSIDRSIKLSDNEEIKEIYNRKIAEAKKREDEEKKAKLQKEIEEKKKALESIN
jgi:hypothetical protein